MEWHEHTDKSLIEYAANHLQHQGPAAMEMQRRLLTAIHDFNSSSTRQARTMIWLTWAIVGLTVVLGIIAWLQLNAAMRASSDANVAAEPPAATEPSPAAPIVPGWQAFFYPNIQAARGKAISLPDLNAAPSFKTLQSCMAWGKERAREVPGAGFQCATGCEFNEIARDIICKDSSPILQ